MFGHYPQVTLQRSAGIEWTSMGVSTRVSQGKATTAGECNSEISRNDIESAHHILKMM